MEYGYEIKLLKVLIHYTKVFINNFILPRMFGYSASSITAEQQRMEQQLATTKVPSKVRR